jgi:4-amino-4-deoxy-L-arabinose transferase-like glycosyltransferase
MRAPDQVLAPASARRLHLLALATTTVLGLFMRTWDLDTLPPAPDPDELSIGYNAWSILVTGRDEYGTAYPAAFRAFGEYKRPAFIYTAVPSIAIFGPTTWAIRLPGAIAGTLTIPAIDAVARTLFGSRLIGLIAAACLTVSPWHLQFSRGAREAAFITLAVTVLALCLAKGFHHAHGPTTPSRRRTTVGWAVGAALAALLAIYSYPGGVVFVPLMVAGWAWAWRARLRQVLPAVAVAVILVAVGAIPLARQLFDGRIGARFAQASILNDPALYELASRRITRDVDAGVPWILDHPFALAARAAVDAYVAHFNPTFLFTSGDGQPRHHGTDTGQLYLWDALPMLAGIATILHRRRSPAHAAVGLWLVIGPVPASFATEAPHAVRTIVMLPAWYLVGAVGATAIWRRVTRAARRATTASGMTVGGTGFSRAGPAIAIAYAAMIIPTVAYYVEATRRYYPVEYPSYWLDGVLEAFAEAQARVATGEFRRVVIPPNRGDTYLYALWATRYDPTRYLSFGGTGQRGTLGRGSLRFDPFEMRGVDWPAEPADPTTLYAFVIMPGRAIPPRARVVHEIRDRGGDIRVVLFTLAG